MPHPGTCPGEPPVGMQGPSCRGTVVNCSFSVTSFHQLPGLRIHVVALLHARVDVQETIFAMPAQGLFSSDHIEDRVPLAAVLGPAHVCWRGGDGAVAGAGPPAESLHDATFVCYYHYDHVKCCLSCPRPLPLVL